MTKAELVEKIYAKSGLETKVKSEAVLDAVISAISECLASGDSIHFCAGDGRYRYLWGYA